MATAPGSPADRRVSPRKLLRGSGTALLSGMAVPVRLTDISEGGMGVIAAANPPAGLQMDLEFPLPIKALGKVRPVRVKVKVMHSVCSAEVDGFKVGLSFVGLDPTTASAIKDFLK